MHIMYHDHSSPFAIIHSRDSSCFIHQLDEDIYDPDRSKSTEIRETAALLHQDPSRDLCISIAHTRDPWEGAEQRHRALQSTVPVDQLHQVGVLVCVSDIWDDHPGIARFVSGSQPF